MRASAIDVASKADLHALAKDPDDRIRHHLSRAELIVGLRNRAFLALVGTSVKLAKKDFGYRRGGGSMSRGFAKDDT